MSIASEITRLQGCKSDIRTALVNKGVTSASSHNMADFAVDISSISSGGATLTVTYSEDFYGVTITATNGTRTLTKLATSSGIVEFNLPEDGTWTVSATVEGQTYSESVLVDTSYEAELTAFPTGSTATPVNVIQTWLKCAQIKDKNYTTLSQVLNDMATFEALVSDSNACDYMVRSTNWASGVAADANAMALIGKFDYCANKLLSNSTWATAIANSTYFESVLNVKVPTMTSATAPSGEVSCSSASSSYPAYYAFDGKINTNWASSVATESWIQYSYPNPIVCKYVSIYDSGHVNQNITIKGSNDGTNFETLATDTLVKQVWLKKYLTNNNTAYRHYRVYMSPTVSSENSGANIIQFYGRTESTMIPLVPKMTSNTTPSGECFGTTNEGTGFDYFNAFDDSQYGWCASASDSYGTAHCGYRFPSPVVVTKWAIKWMYVANLSRVYRLEGSNDGITYTSLCTSDPINTVETWEYFTVDNDTAYTYYRVILVSGTQSVNYSRGQKFQFYTNVDYTDNVLFRSAAQDDIYYLDNGSPVIIAHTDEYGYAIVDRDLLPVDEYLTLYSTVAKDPANLGNAYTKTVHFSKYLTEVYMRPFNALYWYGYESDDLEDCTTANGWQVYTATLVAPTHNTNSIRCNPNNNNLYIAGVGNKTATSSAKTLAFIYQGITVVSDIYGELTYGNSKNLSTSYSQRYINNASVTKDTQSLSTGQYFCIQASRTRVIDISAIWLE